MINKGRYEQKFLITYADYIDLSNRLKMICDLDEHSENSDGYFIRSLYYDDIYATSYTSKINGDNERKKYRLRTYNLSDDIIKLECKEKSNNKIYKRSFEISRFQYEQLASGNFQILETISHPLAMEFYGMYKSVGLKPSVIVDYDRTAFVHPFSNTRITFDMHLRAGIDSFDIFDRDLYTLHVFPNDSVVMEIKYDYALPAHISSLLSTIHGQKTSLSKFCMCKNILGHINCRQTIFY